MSVLSRNNWLSSQRLDITDVRAQDSYNAADLRALIQFFAGNNPYVINGLYTTSVDQLTVTLSAKDAFLFCANTAASSFYTGSPNDPDITVNLVANNTIFLEAVVTRITAQPTDKAFIDITSELTSNNGEAVEFTETVNAQNIVKLSVIQSFGGFSGQGVPIMVVTTGANSVTNMVDSRNLFFSQGQGGFPINQSATYPWAVTTGPSPVSGLGVGTTDPTSPFYSVDSTGSVNDKNLFNLKSTLFALYTAICEIRGVSQWYLSPSGSAIVPNLNLNMLQLDSPEGHSCIGDQTTAITWGKASSGTATVDNMLRTEGINGALPNPLKWQASFGLLEWELGGQFTPGTRSYVTAAFTTPALNPGYSLFLSLIREVALTPNNVIWSPTVAPAGTGWSANRSVVGNTGDFTNVAIGDYIRKQSQGYFFYYRVTAASNGGSPITTDGFILDSSYTAVEVDRAITDQTTEPYIYFRRRYSVVGGDLLVESSSNEFATPTLNNNNYLLGYMSSSGEFTLRGYGTMVAGEKVQYLDSGEATQIYVPNGALRLRHNNSSTYNGTTYVTGGTVSLFKRTVDNKLATNSPLNQAELQFNFPSASITIGIGQGLWVKLADSPASGSPFTLSSGNVSDPSASDVYQVLNLTAEPLRNFDNQNVYLVARAVTIGGNSFLEFSDSSYIGQFGYSFPFNIWAPNIDIGGFTTGSVIFAGASGQLTQDNTAFFWNESVKSLSLGTSTSISNVPFYIKGTSSTSVISRVENTSTGNAFLDIYTNTGTTSVNAFIGAFGNARVGSGIAGQSLEFNAGGTTGSATWMTLTSTGRLGIRTGSPSAVLDVTGTSGVVAFNVSESGTSILASSSANDGSWRIGPVGVTSITHVIDGNVIPGTDNTNDLGSAANRWKELHVGPTSVVFHNDATNTNKINLEGIATGNRVLTLPDATDTLVGRATSDTLTNKNLASSTNILTGATAVSFTNTGTITLPTTTTTLAGLAVAETFTAVQTFSLTNQNTIVSASSIKISSNSQSASIAGAGSIQWTGSLLQYSDGTTWQTLNSTSLSGSGTNTQVAYWTSSSALAGSSGLTYIAGTGELTVTSVNTGTLTSPAGVSWTIGGGGMAISNSITMTTGSLHLNTGNVFSAGGFYSSGATPVKMQYFTGSIGTGATLALSIAATGTRVVGCYGTWDNGLYQQQIVQVFTGSNPNQVCWSNPGTTSTDVEIFNTNTGSNNYYVIIWYV